MTREEEFQKRLVELVKEYGVDISLTESIIRKCAELAEDYDGAHYIGTAIKEYFGVE